MPVKLGDVRKRGKKWVMTVSRSSRNVLAILSKKQEIEFKTKKNVFYEEKDLCEKTLKRLKIAKKFVRSKKKPYLCTLNAHYGRARLR